MHIVKIFAMNPRACMFVFVSVCERDIQSGDSQAYFWNQKEKIHCY